MIRKKASQLRAGDVFYKDAYRDPDPRVDARYTVERLQRIPVHDFFGKLHESVQVTARHHLLGPTRVTLGADEEVWLAEGEEAAPATAPAVVAAAPAAPPSPPVADLSGPIETWDGMAGRSCQRRATTLGKAEPAWADVWRWRPSWRRG